MVRFGKASSPGSQVELGRTDERFARRPRRSPRCGSEKVAADNEGAAFDINEDAVGDRAEGDKRIELDWLLRVRVVVARCGEMDAQRWWNTEGQLCPHGARVLKRGFPRTTSFRAGAVRLRRLCAPCAEIFDPPDAVTFWWLSDTTRRRSSTRVGKDGWTPRRPGRRSSNPSPALAHSDVVAALKSAPSLVDDADDEEAAAKLKVADGEKGVLVPGPFDLGRKAVALWALGFGRGAKGDLRVPRSPPRKA